MLQAQEGLPAILWAVLVVGGLTTVGFTYLFGLRSTTVHVLMVAALALVIGPEAFEKALGSFESSKLSDLR